MTPGPSAAPKAAETPPPTPSPLPAATPAPVPTATLTPTPLPTGREDICYRALPVQESLLDEFSGPDLCAAITVGELFRLKELEVKAKGYSLRRTDFSDMPNLKSLGVSSNIDGLAPDVFHELTGLEDLRIELHLQGNQAIPTGLLSGLPPSLKELDLRITAYREDDERAQLVTIHNGLLDTATGIERLKIYLDGGSHCLKLDPGALTGLSRLEHLALMAGNGIWPIPRELFADLTALESLKLDGPSCRRQDDKYECNYDDGGQHRLYFPTLDVLLKMADYCSNYGYCEAVGLTEQ